MTRAVVTRAVVACAAALWLATGSLARAAPPVPPARPAARTLEQRVDAALRDFRAGDFARAKAEFAGALALVSDAESRSSLQFNIAACEYELADYAAAERHFLELAEQDAGARSSALARAGLSALARTDRVSAQRHLARLSELQTAGGADRRRLEAALAAADQRAQGDTTAAAGSAPDAAAPRDVTPSTRRPVLDAWARLGAGWDSNATQSSLRDAAASSSTAIASAYSALALGLALPIDAGAGTQLSPYYRGVSNLLLARAVQELSEQHHEAGLELVWSPSDDLRWSAAAAAGLGVVGLSQLSAYGVELPLGTALELRHGELLQSTAALELRPLIGLPDYEWTSGLDLDAAIGERLVAGAFSTSLEAGLRWHGAGSDRMAVSPQSLPACGTVCLDADYLIPLGYRAPRLRLRGDWAASAALQLGLSATLEQRDYAGESYLSGLLVSPALRERSRKDRIDWRYQLGLSARYALGQAGRNALWAGYSWRLRQSNVAYSAGDRAHALDYADARYEQHALEAGLELRY